MILVVKNSPADAWDIRDAGSVPGLERFPGGGRGNSLQYSCLESPMDRGAWWATVHGVTKSKTHLKWLSTHALIVLFIHLFVYGHVAGGILGPPPGIKSFPRAVEVWSLNHWTARKVLERILKVVWILTTGHICPCFTCWQSRCGRVCSRNGADREDLTGHNRGVSQAQEDAIK